jgi:hypothetical protein
VKTSIGLVSVVAMTISAFVWIGCDKSTAPVTTTATLSLVSAYTAQQFPTGVAKSSGNLGVDSVKVTRARFVIKNVKFKSTIDSLNFKSDPVLVELNLTGTVQDVSAREVPFGTYRRIEFDVHRIDSTDVSALPAPDRALFSEFLAGQRYSVIVDGTVYKTGLAAQSFTYRSKIDAQQKIDLSPQLTVSEASPSGNATMLISSFSWFKNQTGVLVDPADPNSEGVIDENLKNSIRVFKDNNKRGTKDIN